MSRLTSLWPVLLLALAVIAFPGCAGESEQAKSDSNSSGADNSDTELDENTLLVTLELPGMT